jgi:uncharacterized protein YcbK (DUF882 family)
MELYELRMKSKGAGAAGMEGTQAYTQAQTQAQTQRKKGRTSRLDAIAEEEEDEDEEEEEEAVTQAAKRKSILSMWLTTRTWIQDVYRQIDPLSRDTRNDGRSSRSEYPKR